MDHDFRNNNNNRTNPPPPPPPPPPYTSQSQMYNRPPPSSSSSSSPHPMYGPPPPPSSLYPKVGQHPVNPPPAFHPAPSPPSSYSAGIGIRVRLKPEFRITPPPQLLLIEDVPQSTFQFDFDLERKILAESEKETPNWSNFGPENLPSQPVKPTSSVGFGLAIRFSGSVDGFQTAWFSSERKILAEAEKETPNWTKLGLENLPSQPVKPTSSVQSPTTDPVLSKFLASGLSLSREDMPLEVAHYGDNPTKVRELGMAYMHLRKMGFRSENAAEALLMYDNDTAKALAYLLNN